MIDSVLSDYSKVIRLDKRFPYVFSSRGFVYLELSEAQLAIADFKKQIEYYPDIADSYYGLSRAYFSLDSFKLADKYINTAIKLDSTFMELYVWKGEMYLMLNDTELALENFNKVLSCDSTIIKAYYGKGVCLLNIGNYKHSEYYIKKAIQHKPEAGEFYMSLGYLYLKQNMIEEAKKCYEKAAKLGIKTGIDSMFNN
jgi:tetratricopeptide (TPR) repeat protein